MITDVLLRIDTEQGKPKNWAWSELLDEENVTLLDYTNPELPANWQEIVDAINFGDMELYEKLVAIAVEENPDINIDALLVTEITYERSRY